MRWFSTVRYKADTGAGSGPGFGAGRFMTGGLPGLGDSSGLLPWDYQVPAPSYQAPFTPVDFGALLAALASPPPPAPVMAALVQAVGGDGGGHNGAGGQGGQGGPSGAAGPGGHGGGHGDQGGPGGSTGV